MPSTDIVRAPDSTSGALAIIDLAPQAWALAQRLAGTDFVPQALRGKPEQVLAVVLAGAEVGISPMTSLQKIHNIKGKPGMAAELMRALVFQHGHELWIEEQSSTRCIVVGKRRGSTRETKITWTLDDAKRAKLVGKDVWQQYPAAMLLARATAALCRAIFPDVLSGISYTVEELEDGDVIDVEALIPEEPPAPAAPTTATRARRAATRGAETTGPTEPEPTPPVERDEAPLPGEDEDDEILDAELVDEQPATAPDGLPAEPEFDVDPDDYEGPDQHIEGSGPSYSGPQVIAIKASERGLTRDEKLEFCGLALDRPVASTKDLTADEITVVIELLNNDQAFEALWQGQEDEPEPDPTPPPAPRRRRAEPAAETPAPSPVREQVSTWTGDQWRALLAERGVKVTELLREASRLAREDGATALTTLDDVKGSGFEDLLLGFVEDLASQRSGS